MKRMSVFVSRMPAPESLYLDAYFRLCLDLDVRRRANFKSRWTQKSVDLICMSLWFCVHFDQMGVDDQVLEVRGNVKTRWHQHSAKSNKT
jgi:hypothetical protein